MNKLKILLLYPIIANIHVFGMDFVVEQPLVEAVTTQSSRVPSLRKMVLSKIGSLLLQPNCPLSLAALKAKYPNADTDCARVLAEDQRVALWHAYGKERSSIELDHRPLLMNDMPLNMRENTVYAAAFIDQFLITLTCRRGAEADYVVYVWRMDDISTQIRATRNKGPAPQNAEQVEPINPLSEFVLRRVYYNQNDAIKLVCNQTNNRFFVVLPQGDCYFLNLTEEGTINRIWRFNVLPRARLALACEGTPEEGELYRDKNAYIESLAFNSTGTRVLIHVANEPLPGTGYSPWRGELYCIPLEDEHLYAHSPVINALDHAHKIADEVMTTCWGPDETILFIDTTKWDILYTADTHGNIQVSRKLNFEGIKKDPLCPHTLQMRTYSNELLIFSKYIRGGGHSHNGRRDPRIDKCFIQSGFCTRLLDMQDLENEIHFTDCRHHSSTNYVEYLPNERFALKIFRSGQTLRVVLWDMLNDSSATLTELSTSNEDYTYALSPCGSFLFLADHPTEGKEPYMVNFVQSLQTPHSSIATLEELITLGKKIKK